MATVRVTVATNPISNTKMHQTMQRTWKLSVNTNVFPDYVYFGAWPVDDLL